MVAGDGGGGWRMAAVAGGGEGGAEYYRNVINDDTYAKRHEKEIRYAMTSCLRKRDEERMKKSVEEMVNNLRKVAEEVNTEAVEVEVAKEIKSEEVVENEKVEKAVIEEQQIGEDEKKEEEEVKNENVEAGDAGDEVSAEEKLNDADQKQTETATNTEVPITEVLNKNKDCEIGGWSSLAQQEEEIGAGPWFG
ncbi:FK506-binding protein 5-like [Helianthus annuus]|uniref:FK506-binding protein 5-like n=1 Tax=Helianthus annuus TaxID=4232 RepID=UPI000B8F0D1E|nr:FK506-binding protein 5-like [Helianthus annuus]